MNTDIRDEGQVANIRGVIRDANPYRIDDPESRRVDWDTGWLLQTQEWALPPKSMCKGLNCTALKGSGHSRSCIKEHEEATHMLHLL